MHRRPNATVIMKVSTKLGVDGRRCPPARGATDKHAASRPFNRACLLQYVEEDSAFFIVETRQPGDIRVREFYTRCATKDSPESRERFVDVRRLPHLSLPCQCLAAQGSVLQTREMTLF